MEEIEIFKLSINLFMLLYKIISIKFKTKFYRRNKYYFGNNFDFEKIPKMLQLKKSKKI